MTYRDILRAIQPKFPLINEDNSRPTSPYDEGYNCIAWAAEDTEHWWWPDVMGQFYWPPNAQRIETIDAFVEAYGLLGYVDRCDATLQRGRQKVAIYTASNGKPTHAARQLSDGWWASKLGKAIDIEHELHALDGPIYGTVAIILARPV